MDLGLEMNRQLAVVDGTHQIAGQEASLAFFQVRVGVIDMNASTTLGFVHGLVGPLEEGRTIHAVERTLCDTDGNSKCDQLMIDQHGLANGMDHLLRYKFGVCEALAQRKQTRELIAAKSSYGIRFTYHGGQSLGHLAKGGVTNNREWS